MDPLQFRRPAALVYLSMREKGREIVRHGLAAVPPSQHCGTRLWARTTSDYSKAFTRIRDAVAALPVESAVLDGEAIVMRSADRCDFEALRSREGQAEAILVAYDIMEVDGLLANLSTAPARKLAGFLLHPPHCVLPHVNSLERDVVSPRGTSRRAYSSELGL
jgi:hypothetical protein